jgi:hypothetical protein
MRRVARCVGQTSCRTRVRGAIANETRAAAAFTRGRARITRRWRSCTRAACNANRDRAVAARTLRGGSTRSASRQCSGGRIARIRCIRSFEGRTVFGVERLRACFTRCCRCAGARRGETENTLGFQACFARRFVTVFHGDTKTSAARIDFCATRFRQITARLIGGDGRSVGTAIVHGRRCVVSGIGRRGRIVGRAARATADIDRERGAQSPKPQQKNFSHARLSASRVPREIQANRASTWMHDMNNEAFTMDCASFCRTNQRGDRARSAGWLVTEVRCKPTLHLLNAHRFALAIGRNLIAIDFAEREIPRLRMREVKTADARARPHRE